MAITFDGITLDGTDSMTNFAQGYPTVLDIPSRVINSPSRVGGIVILDTASSVPFQATYQILSGADHSNSQRTEYNVIKAKQGTTGSWEPTRYMNLILRLQKNYLYFF